MKKDVLGPVVLFVFVLAAFPASSVSYQDKAEKDRTLQMIGSYRSWGRANPQPIILSLDQIDVGG